MSVTSLDDSVFGALEALRERDLRDPDVLLLVGTGTGTLPGALVGAARTALAELPGVPAIWSGGELVTGRLASASVWIVEDAPGELEYGESGPPAPAWERAWPVWLAAAGGAGVALVTAAGGALRPGIEPGGLAVLTDHLNLSGQTPLSGLGETRLGPLFPDQSLVHHAGLRARALKLARQRGIALGEGVAACVAGPALTTPAERRWYRTAGADVFVQGLAGPLIAAAHAGTSTLTLVAVTEGADEPLSMSGLVARAEACAPALEDLILCLAPDLAQVAAEHAEEGA